MESKKRNAAKMKYLKEQLLKPKNLRTKEVLKKQKKAEKKERRHDLILKRSLIRAGITEKPEKFHKLIFRIAIVITIFLGFFMLQRVAVYFKFDGIAFLPLLLIALWFGTFMLVFLLLWLILYFTLDIISYKRKLEIEDVLQDFLLLTSANIRSGMPIDRALWYAVRPRFGILSKEIELVAKETISGQPLDAALMKFADKYNSPLLRNSINLLIEGINAGGEIGELLNKIAISIQENKLLKKEMAAGISSYAIFITVAALVIAPLMFALASQLLVVITNITANIEIPDVSLSAFSFASGGVTLSQTDFLIFAITNLLLTAFFCAIIVAVIKKGEIKTGLKNIPIYIAISLTIFFFSYKLFSGVFGGII